MITDETVERVRESADIVQVIGEHVKLKRVGSSFRGPCPFHQGTHANFSVVPNKGIYHCFVCHESGDVFTFVQKRLGLDFPAAVKYIGERAGILVEEVQRRREGPDPRQPFWDANAAAAEFFRAQLWDESEGEEARNYLALRRVSREVADRFGLGSAPRDADALRSHLNALGMSDERLLETGLLVQREDAEELRPRFRNRLIFPIQDAAGNVVGFGGRLLGPGEPKYLNSAESPVFSKARLLYGLHMAKHAIRKDDRVLVVEGYFDVVRVVTAGFDWVVAPLGTALTDDQAAMLRRYTKNAFLLYDSDAAGLKATFRAGDQLLRQKMSVQVVTLPEGEDPDSFVDKFGGQRLAEQIEHAVDIFERRVMELQRRGYFTDLRRKRQAIDKLLPTLRATADEFTREIYLAKTAEVSQVSREVLERELGVAPATPGASEEHAAPGAREDAEPGSSSDGARERRQRSRRESDRRREPRVVSLIERELVRVLLHDPARIEEVGEQIGPDDLRDLALRDIYEALLAGGARATLESVAQRIAPESVPVFEQLQEQPLGDGLNIAATITGAVSRIRGQALRDRMREIDGELRIASPAEKDGLIREKERLRRELEALGAGTFKSFDRAR